MPLIKDKYRSRGSDIRSKFVVRTENRAIENPTPIGMSTEQIQEIETKKYRENPANASQISIRSQATKESLVYSTLGAANVSTLNAAKLIITLKTAKLSFNLSRLRSNFLILIDVKLFKKILK